MRVLAYGPTRTSTDVLQHHSTYDPREFDSESRVQISCNGVARAYYGRPAKSHVPGIPCSMHCNGKLPGKPLQLDDSGVRNCMLNQGPRFRMAGEQQYLVPDRHVRNDLRYLHCSLGIEVHQDVVHD